MPLTDHQLQLFKELTELRGVSGQEKEINAYLTKKYEELGLEIVRDNLGSLFAYKPSKKPNAKKVMIAGHMDEVGLIVVKINPNSLLKADPVGGLNSETLLAHRIHVQTTSGTWLPGAIDAIPPHLQTAADRDSVTPIKNMLFDFGFRSEEEARLAGIKEGSQIVVDGEFVSLNNGQRILGKAFDNRYGLVLGLDLLEHLQDVELDVDLYVGGTVQEEVGLRGAETASYLIDPDLAIVLDCSPARDSSGDTSQLGQLGDGVLIRYFDRGMIAFKELLDYQMEAADKTGVKYQYFDSPGGTDAGAIHKKYSGIRTLTHCIVARNIHTCSSVIDIDDYIAARETLIYMIENLDDERFESWAKARR